MDVNERIYALRTEMEIRGIDIYLVPSSDDHGSEYINEYYKSRQYLTGFTGSAGTAVVTMCEAGLWTDGRYFLQAEQQIQGSQFRLFPMGKKDVPSVFEYVRDHLKEGMTLGFDGRMFSMRDAKKYENLASEKLCRLKTDIDLIGEIWTDRPPISTAPIIVLPEEYTGEAIADKLDRIRTEIQKKHAQVHIVSSLDDVAWILNIRGGDIAHVPVPMAYLIVGVEERADLFIREGAVDETTAGVLAAAGVRIFDYDTIYETAAAIPVGVPVLLDEERTNYHLYKSLGENQSIVSGTNPSWHMKAVKNDTEIQNTRIAHLRDGIAMTKFIYRIKTLAGHVDINEYEAGRMLDRFRKEQEHFVETSFENICAFGTNAAMMHYQAEKEGSARIVPGAMLLIDSGGHYLEGSTDVTRTIVLGDIPDLQKEYFTLVCIGNLELAGARFLYGCTGRNLDILARHALWQRRIDYRSGTGHGVGHLLNVHEGPNAIRWKPSAEPSSDAVLEPGMITTDEPGVYMDGRFGIRTENELLCIRDEENEYGQFLAFENLTLVPIDLDGINPALMTRRQKDMLNTYHQTVREKLSPYLSNDERTWLRKYTRKI